MADSNSLFDPNKNPECADTIEILKNSIDAATDLMQLARSFMQSDRPIDLAGLDHEVGLICAKALDLSQDFRHAIRHALIQMLQEAELLNIILKKSANQISP